MCDEDTDGTRCFVSSVLKEVRLTFSCSLSLSLVSEFQQREELPAARDEVLLHPWEGRPPLQSLYTAFDLFINIVVMLLLFVALNMLL